MSQPPDGDRQQPQPPESHPAPPGPHVPPDQPPASHRAMGGGARRGLMIAVVIVVAALVLSGISVGAWLLLSDSDRDGAAAPTDAVDAFLQAVYRDQDAAAASALVCSEARDEQALQDQIDSIRAFQDDYPNPSYAWDEPQVADETDQLAIVAVTITMVTGDERTADQELRVSVLNKAPHGWWVCDVQSPPADDEADDTDDEADAADAGDDDEDPDADEDDGDDE
jgi:hypothetical protein